MGKPIKFILILILFPVLFVGVGLLNHKNYQYRAKDEAEILLKQHFLNSGEKVIKTISPDYSMGQIEIGVITDKNSYYAVLGDTNSWLSTDTILNLYTKPKLQIVNIKPEKF